MILGINVKSARSIIRRMVKRDGIPSLPSGGCTVRKVDSEMKEELEAIVAEYPTKSVKEINQNLRLILSVKLHVSNSCISKTLDGMFYSMKKTCLQPAQRNSYAVKKSRQRYAQWFLQNAIDANCVFFDESGCNLWTQRARGRSKV